MLKLTWISTLIIIIIIKKKKILESGSYSQLLLKGTCLYCIMELEQAGKMGRWSMLATSLKQSHGPVITYFKWVFFFLRK